MHMTINSLNPLIITLSGVLVMLSSPCAAHHSTSLIYTRVYICMCMHIKLNIYVFMCVFVCTFVCLDVCAVFRLWKHISPQTTKQSSVNQLIYIAFIGADLYLPRVH